MFPLETLRGSYLVNTSRGGTVNEQDLYEALKSAEFTGRVCPALCEAACTCGLSADQ